jgi:hypothetical protein
MEFLSLRDRRHAAAVFDAPGRAIRVREMHKVLQFHLPVMLAMRSYHLVRVSKPVSLWCHLIEIFQFQQHRKPTSFLFKTIMTAPV